MTTQDIVERLVRTLGAARTRRTASGTRLEVAGLDVEALARAAADTRLRLGAITGTPLPSGETALVYHFVGPDGFVDVATLTRNGAIGSLTPHLKPASWAEREIHDLFAVDFLGHPDPSPLMRPEGFEPGMMRAPMCAARRWPEVSHSE